MSPLGCAGCEGSVAHNYFLPCISLVSLYCLSLFRKKSVQFEIVKQDFCSDTSTKNKHKPSNFLSISFFCSNKRC